MDSSPPSASPASTATPSSSSPSPDSSHPPLASHSPPTTPSDTSAAGSSSHSTPASTSPTSTALYSINSLPRKSYPDSSIAPSPNIASFSKSGRLTESEKMVRRQRWSSTKNPTPHASSSEERVEECSPYDEIDRTVLYGAYKDWCVFNRFSPDSARRLYSSIWDVFRIKTDRSHGRRLFKGIQLLPVEELALNAVEAGAQGAQRGQE